MSPDLQEMPGRNSISQPKYKEIAVVLSKKPMEENQEKDLNNVELTCSVKLKPLDSKLISTILPNQ